MVKNMNNFEVYLTFDLDYINYINGRNIIDEFSIVENIILPYLEEKNINATWFIRLDKKIGIEFGVPDFLFVKYKKTIDRLLQLGHKIAWHPHSYIKKDGKWVQDTNEKSVLEELYYLLPYVKKYNLDIVRVGWGYQTNKIMKFFNDNGFKIDSTCMARPKYKWDMTTKDWEISSNYSYYPSNDDYRIEGNKNLKILEVPITTIDMPVVSDTEKVKRYINLSFYNTILKRPIKDWMKKENFLVSIIHPYELFKSENKHHIISFDIEEFKTNIEFIVKEVNSNGKKVIFKTLDGFLND